MPSDIILRGEDDLADELAVLLREPSPEGVWHVPGHPPPVETSAITRIVGRALRAVTGRARRAAPPLDDDGIEDGDRRFGLWLTRDHLLLADDDGPSAVRRKDIVGLRVRPTRGLSRRKRDLLVFDLRQGHLHFPVDWCEGWADRPDELRAEIDRRLKAGHARTDALEDFAANRQFDGFGRWLDTEIRRLQPDATSRAQLLELTSVVLSSWPDETRRAPPDWFLAGAADGGRRHAFARDEASWLLPLSRTATFDAATLFLDVDSVADCALTFREVPLTVIELDGGVSDGSFEALLLWAATKPLRTLTMTGATESQRARLADFKREHGIA